jgi:hypothetical protein
MLSIKSLPAPEYSDEDKHVLIDFLLALKKTHLRDFFRAVELPSSGTKPELRERIEHALDEGIVTHEQVVTFLDVLALWGKQHVYLYSGPRGDLRPWKDPELLQQHLKQHRVGKYFNARLPLVLPDQLTLSSITHLDGKVRITAVQKKIYAERAPEHDAAKDTEAGPPIELRAYVQHVARAIVTFEWDLSANTAVLQITQLHGDRVYEQVAKEFCRLVGAWLDIERAFALVDIRGAIRALHESEAAGRAEARSHGIQYRSLRGRRLSAHSPSPRDSVIGEPDIDNAMNGIRKNGVGHLGNFYWLPSANGAGVSNPLSGEVHVILVADKSRINFPTPNSEDVVRYVLHRVRAIGANAP